MATYVDMAGTINRIRALLPNIGNIYYVDADAGVDAASRGTYALPLRTIDYAISNYVTNYNGDVVICWGSAGGDFDEFANVDGVQVDKVNTAIIGINMPKVDNSNVGATSIFHVTVQSCRIWGFACVPTVPIIGVHCDSLFAQIGGTEFGMGFEDCSVDVQLDGNQNICEGNRHTNSSIGYLCNGSTQEIRNNIMMGTGAGGSIGVSITLTTPSVQNYIHDNDITGYETGIKAALAAIQNTGCRNALNSTTTDIDDANAVGLNNWEGNYITGAGVDLEPVIKRLQEMGVTGDIFFVDTAGNDANPGTYALPCLTIDHTVGLCTAYHNDAVVVTDSLFNNYDEAVNVDGVQLDVAGMTLVGIGNDILVTNSNVAAVSTFHITADQVNIYGINGYGGTFPSLHTEDGDWCMIGKEGWKTTFRGATGGTGIFHEEGSNCKYQYIDIDGVSTGIQLQDVYNEIHHCDIQGDNAGGSLGITLDNPGSSNWNYIHDNAITNFALGLDAANNTLNNIFADNSILCFLPTSDGNAANVNGWINNKVPGEISRGGLLQSDLASINSRGFPEAGQNVSGTYRFVSTGGSDANGSGTWARPYATITHAMGLSSDGDTIICVDPTAAMFDENIGITGLSISSGVTVIGIGLPWLTNSNVGATSVVDFQDAGRITGFVIRATVAGCNGVVMNTNNSRVDHCELQDAGAAGIGIQIIVAPVEVDNNFINAWTTGIEDGPGIQDKIHDNTINDCATAIKLIGVGAGALIRHNWLYQSVPAATIAFSVAVGCGVHNITDNYVHGYPANSFLAPVNFVSNHIESQIAANNTLEEDLGDIYNSITGSSGSVGNIFFVDTAGSDANPGTHALPFLTIDFAVGACVTDHNDAIIVTDTLGAGFDENVNVDGVQVDVNGVTIVGVGNPHIENSNAGVTSTFNISANDCKIMGFDIDANTAIGILMGGTNNILGTEEFPNLIMYASIAVSGAGSDYAQISFLTTAACDMACYLGTFAQVYQCIFSGEMGVAPSVGIDLGPFSMANFIHDNSIVGFDTGVNIQAGAVQNVLTDNSIITPVIITDVTATGVNAFVNNRTVGGIGKNNTLEQDLTDIFNKSDENTGKTFYVSNGGSDVTGNGSYYDPWGTINFAVTQCVGGRHDTVVVQGDAFGGGGAFNENAANTGVLVDKQDIVIVGVDHPYVENNKNGATGVFTISVSYVTIKGFNIHGATGGQTAVPIIHDGAGNISNIYIMENRIWPGNNAAEGVYFTASTELHVENNEFYASGHPAVLFNACQYGYVNNNIFDMCTTGVRLQAGTVQCWIMDNTINGGTLSVDIVVGCAGNRVLRNTISNAPMSIASQYTYLQGNKVYLWSTTFPITAAMTDVEQTLVDFTPWKDGQVDFNCDVSTIIANEVGKMVTFKLYAKIDDTNLKPLAQTSFVAGSDTLHPHISLHSVGDLETVRATVKMSATVGANRDIIYKMIQED